MVPHFICRPSLCKLMGLNEEVYEHKRKERFELIRLREHSKEPKDFKTFIVLNDFKIGFEINWEKETVAWFLYKEKKRLASFMTEPLSLYAGTLALKHSLFSLINDHYKRIGKDRIPLYAEMELSVPVNHLDYLVWSGTLAKALARQEV